MERIEAVERRHVEGKCSWLANVQKEAKAGGVESANGLVLGGVQSRSYPIRSQWKLEKLLPGIKSSKCSIGSRVVLKGRSKTDATRNCSPMAAIANPEMRPGRVIVMPRESD